MIFYAEVECMLYEGQSLKNKRSVLKRITTRISQEFNVAIAELDYQDLWQRTKLGIVTVSNDAVRAERVIQQVLNYIDSFPEIERTLTNVERL